MRTGGNYDGEIAALRHELGKAIRLLKRVKCFGGQNPDWWEQMAEVIASANTALKKGN